MRNCIPQKTKGKFPGRNKRETNVIRSMRTELSVVSQTQLYESADMIQKSLRMLVIISIFFCLLLLFYLASFLGVGLFLDLVLQKLNSMLLAKGIRFLFSRLGWFGLLVEGLLVLGDNSGGWCNMMAPSGGSGGDKEVTSSNSGNWRQYLNLSDDKERDSAPEPSTARAPALREAAHEPSTSSTWSGSWIEKWLSSEISSSAPNQGPPAVDQNQGGHEARNPPTEVMGPEAPSPSWLKNHIQSVFYKIKGRRTRSDIIERLWEDLRLERASPEKRMKILQIMEEMYRNSDSFQNKNSRLDIDLAVSISDWERNPRD